MSTVSEEGKVNLSPYSYFGAMGHDPPMVCIPRRRAVLIPLDDTSRTSFLVLSRPRSPPASQLCTTSSITRSTLLAQIIEEVGHSCCVLEVYLGIYVPLQSLQLLKI